MDRKVRCFRVSCLSSCWCAQHFVGSWWCVDVCSTVCVYSSSFPINEIYSHCFNCMFCFVSFPDNGRIHEQTCILNCEWNKNTFEVTKEHEDSAKKKKQLFELHEKKVIHFFATYIFTKWADLKGWCAWYSSIYLWKHCCTVYRPHYTCCHLSFTLLACWYCLLLRSRHDRLLTSVSDPCWMFAMKTGSLCWEKKIHIKYTYLLFVAFYAS